MSDYSFSYTEVWNLLRGEKLGSGSARKVWKVRFDHSLVVKKEMKAGSFQNIIEAEIWEDVAGTDLNRWFAPVVNMSGSGAYLIMKRTFPIRLEDMPKEIPAFFTDTKIQNWGWYQGRPVCHDYGTLLIGFMRDQTDAMAKKGKVKMRKPKWWVE